MAPFEASEVSGEYIELDAFCEKGRLRESQRAAPRGRGVAGEEVKAAGARKVLIKDLLSDAGQVAEHCKCCKRC